MSLTKNQTLSIFIFRRDLRLHDNLGLIKSLQESTQVIPIFIFTPEQIKHNIYKSNNAIQFMVESLENLQESLKLKHAKLYFFYGDYLKVLKSLITNLKITNIYANIDYTYYSITRDDNIKNLCIKHNVKFIRVEDILLNPVNSIKNNQDNIYTKFTPYYNKAKKIKIPQELKNNYTNYYTKSITNNYLITNINNFHKNNSQIAVHGGRTLGLLILKNLSEFKDYNKTHDIMSLSTTKLSAYNKFGCVSIREVYHNIIKHLTNKSTLIKQLYWRDFFYNISYNYVRVLNKDKNQFFKEKYNKVKFITYDKATQEQKELWYKWCNGTTGFPIIDAAMRELNETGFMHNRCRLLVASFLTKNMLWSWLDGEKYFANNLVDYDPSINNGNWQWVSGSGVDSQPYYRIFNPYVQTLKFDKECLYIKKHIKELKDIDTQDILNWDQQYHKYNTYFKPMLDYTKSRQVALNAYRRALK
jgi:deoxyribodipyrimidine photo-lyase